MKQLAGTVVDTAFTELNHSHLTASLRLAKVPLANLGIEDFLALTLNHLVLLTVVRVCARDPTILK